eukprot:gene9022-9957_t
MALSSSALLNSPSPSATPCSLASPLLPSAPAVPDGTYPQVILFNDAQVFWRCRTTIELVMVEHHLPDSFTVLEVIAYDPLLQDEAPRLYLEVNALEASLQPALLSQLQREELKTKSLGGIFQSEDRSHVLLQDLKIDFVLTRLHLNTKNQNNVEKLKQLLTEKESQWGISMITHFNDVKDPETGQLKILLPEKPPMLLPAVVNHSSKRSEHSWLLVKKLLKVPKNFHLRRSSSHDSNGDHMPTLFTVHSSSSASMDSGATLVVDTTNRGVMVDNSISSSLSPIHEINLRGERKLPPQPTSSSAFSHSADAAYSTPLVALSSLDTSFLPMGAVPSMPATPMIAGGGGRPLAINTNAFFNHFHLLPTHDDNAASSVPLLTDATYTTSVDNQQHKVEGHGSAIRLFPLHRRSPKTNDLSLDGNRSPSETRGGERKILSFLNTIFHSSNSPKAQDSHASREEGVAPLKPLHGILKTPQSSSLPSGSASMRGRSSSSPALPRASTPLSVKGGKEGASASTASPSPSLPLSHPNTPLEGSRSSIRSVLLPPLSPPSQQSSVTTTTSTTTNATTATPAAAPYTFARCQATYYHNLHSDHKKNFQQRLQRMRSVRGRLLVGNELEDTGEVSKWDEQQEDQGKNKEHSCSSSTSYHSEDPSPPTRLSLEKEDSDDSGSDSERCPTRKYFDTSALHQSQLSDQDSSSVASSSSTYVTHQSPPPLLTQGSLQKLHSFVSLVAQRASMKN